MDFVSLFILWGLGVIAIVSSELAQSKFAVWVTSSGKKDTFGHFVVVLQLIHRQTSAAQQWPTCSFFHWCVSECQKDLSLFSQVNSTTQTQKESDKRTKVDVKCGQRVKMENVREHVKLQIWISLANNFTEQVINCSLLLTYWLIDYIAGRRIVC